ncbi:MAG: VWA domain-containing protein [Candidatus Heimdallarchaeota archaeon]|nr:VWA domain-containing protein [Candidatus Heimdallarchaeota archaeon]
MKRKNTKNSQPITNLIFNKMVKESDDLRKILIHPTIIPYNIRKLFSQLVFSDLYGDNENTEWLYEKLREEGGILFSFFQQLKKSDYWISIKELSKGNEVLSAQITTKLLEKIRELLEDYSQIPEDEELDEYLSKLQILKDLIEASKELWDRKIKEEKLEDIKELITKFDQPEEEEETQVEELMDDILLGIWEQAKEYNQLFEILNLLLPGRGWNFARGLLKSKFFKNILHYSKLLEKLPALQEIVDRLGRAEAQLGAKEWRISPFSTTEVHSIEKSGDINRILPCELIRLSHPVTKYVFYASMFEKRLLSFQLKGWEQTTGPPKEEKRGPIVACVDTSGSMHGVPEILAKTLILAIIRRVAKEKREVKVILFGSRGETTSFEFKRTEKGFNDLLNFLSESFGGGTDFDSAMKTALKSVEKPEFERADLLFISDGLGQFRDSKLNSRWENWKEENDACFYSVVIANDRPGGLSSISNEIFYLSSDYKTSSREIANVVLKVENRKKLLEKNN